MNILKSDIDKILNLNQKSLEYESELLFHSMNTTYEEFVNILSVLKKPEKHGIFRDLHNNWSSIPTISNDLDIFLHDSPESTYHSGFRITIRNEHIQTFCRLGDIKNIPYEIVYKKPVEKSTTLSNFDVKLNIKEELEYNHTSKSFSKDDKDASEIDELFKRIKMDNFKRLYKTYRLKNRYSFTDTKEFHSLDMTIVRSSNVPTIKFIDSNLFNQEKTYEIELEINKHITTELLKKQIKKINKSIKIKKTDNLSQLFIENTNQTIIKDIEKCIEFIYKSKNKYPFLTTSQEQKDIQYIFKEFINYHKLSIIRNKILLLQDESHEDTTHFRNLLGTEDSKDTLVQKYIDMQKIDSKENTYFIGPKPVSMLINHLQSDELINTKYCVTDKADGMGKLLFVVGLNHLEEPDKYERYNNRLYLIDHNLTVYNTNYITTDSYNNSLFNGEYMNTDREGDSLNIFKIYDCYYLRNEIMYYKPLLSSDSPSRISETQNYLDTIDLYNNNKEKIDNSSLRVPNVLDENQNMTIDVKEFYELNSENFHTVTEQLWNTYLDKKTLYKYDGLIFTPYDCPVGYTKNIDYDLQTHNTWFKNIKWKPPYENTIDFLIKYENNKDTMNSFKQHIINTKIGLQKYQVVNLYNGKNSFIPNPCIKSTRQKVGVYNPVFFNPSYSEKNIHIAYLEIDQQSNKSYCKEWNQEEQSWVIKEPKEIINNDSIIEFAYDKNIPDKKFRWIPIRVRHDKTFNYKKAITTKKNIFHKIQKLLQLQLTNKKFSKLLNELRPIFRTIPTFRNLSIDNFDKNRKLLSEYFKNENIIKYNIVNQNIQEIHINFGNDYKTANSVWKSIQNPVTEDILFGKQEVSLEIDNDSKYYNRDLNIKRENSLTIHLQTFHNRIKNELIYISTNYLLELGFPKENIKLLDLACGKGGDLYKWYSNGIKNVVGIDDMTDNIFNPDDGACLRRNNLLIQKEIDNSQFNVNFLVGDISDDLNNELSYNDSISSELAKEVMMEKHSFDIVSIMFAIHYLFKDEQTLDKLIENIDNNLKPGGLLIGTCLDGDKVVDLLKDYNLGDSMTGVKDNQVIWKITKKYSINSLPEDNKSLNQVISVTMNSINREIDEYLVKFKFLENKLKEKNINVISNDVLQNFTLKSTNTFDDVYNNIEKLSIRRPISLSDDEKKISFLSRYFIFQKNS